MDSEIDLDLGRPGRAAANAERELWAASERKYHAIKRQELVEVWSDFYLALAAAHERIADENREKAARLFAGAGRP